MIDSFLARGLPKEQAHSELIVILFVSLESKEQALIHNRAGGTDTTATAAQATIFSILSSPDAHVRLQHEIDTFLESNPGGLSATIKDADARKLPYLQACILESLRKYPPLFQLRERIVASQGDFLHGYEIPPGTFVGVNGLATQLDSVYGDDVETFKPERWLTANDVQLKQMHSTLELVFGYGNSKCLGMNMAYMELNKLIFEVRLARQFERRLR
jgi:cytochrome P450